MSDWPVTCASKGSGAVVPVAAATKAASFAVGNGTANGSPASVVVNTSVGGARSWACLLYTSRCV